MSEYRKNGKQLANQREARKANTQLRKYTIFQ